MYISTILVETNNGDFMITNHIIKDDKVILYLDYSFEFASLGSKEKHNFFNKIYDYLKNTKINVDGKKIVLMLGSTLIATLIYTGGMMKLEDVNGNIIQTSNIVETVGTVDFQNTVEEINEEVKEEIIEKKVEQIVKEETTVKKSTNQTSKNTTEAKTTTTAKKNNQPEQASTEDNSKEKTETKQSENLVTVYRSNGTILQIEMEEYLVGVVAAEMPASFNSEALKAQAVIARTYALKKISKGEILTDTVSTQSYIDTNQMKSKWGNEYNKYYNKIVQAVSSTKGEYITYNGEYIEAVYHSTSNGYTEDAKNVWGKSYPYLKSVESSWDKSVSSYLKIETKEFETLLKILGLTIDNDTEISIISRNDSGRVSEVKIGNKSYTGVELRNILGLRSADFDIEINDGIVTIITRGYGHGVGMSQYGANEMAKLGYNYKDIISYYYNGVTINK